MDEFHGLKGGSGSSVFVSMGAHNQSGKESWHIVSSCKAMITWFGKTPNHQKKWIWDLLIGGLFCQRFSFLAPG